MTATKLRNAIETVVTDDTEARARNFATLLATEDGTRQACNQIEAVIHAS